MENLKKEVTREELDNGEVLNNHVLCYAHYSNEGVATKAGIVVGFNNSLTYASEDGKDTSSHIADVAEISLIIHRTPESLYFNPDDPKGMDWETEMKLAKGDIIWTNPIDALNALTLVCEGEEYKLINYADIYVAKRDLYGRKLGASVPNFYYENICLNGYCLLKQVPKPKISDLDVTSQDKFYKDRGIIAFVGEPNKRHRSPEVMDFQDVQEGDLVLLDKKCTPFMLERMSAISRFGDESLWVIPRKYIDLVLERK